MSAEATDAATEDEGPVGRGKRRVLAGTLAIVIGWTGAHHFYLGSTLAGLVMCGVSLITCGLPHVLGVAEGIAILKMSDEEFDERYNLRTPGGFEFAFQSHQREAPP